jgi:hypothetical protein
METASATFNYQDFSDYLGDIEAQISPRRALSDIDEILAGVESDLDSYNEMVSGSDEKTRREMAMSAMEAYNLNLLSQDENFNVRTLALCNPAVSPAILDQVADDAATSDKYTLMIVANNPSATIATLNKIFDFGGDELEICNAILANPNCDDVLRFKVEGARLKASGTSDEGS